MKKLLMLSGMLFLLGMLAPTFTRAAHAQVVNRDPVVCDASMSWEQCQAAQVSTESWVKPRIAGGKDATYYKGCQKPTTYDNCLTYCECGYQTNLKKQGCGRACADVATSERDACLGMCITDFS